MEIAKSADHGPSATQPIVLLSEQVQFFQQEGYLIVPKVFDPEDVEPLRQQWHHQINLKAREIKALGKLTRLHDELGFDRQLAAIYRDSPEIGEMVLRDLQGASGA